MVGQKIAYRTSHQGWYIKVTNKKQTTFSKVPSKYIQIRNPPAIFSPQTKLPLFFGVAMGSGASSATDETTSKKCLELGWVCVTGGTSHVDGASDVYPSEIWVLWALLCVFRLVFTTYGWDEAMIICTLVVMIRIGLLIYFVIGWVYPFARMPCCWPSHEFVPEVDSRLLFVACRLDIAGTLSKTNLALLGIFL